MSSILQEPDTVEPTPRNLPGIEDKQEEQRLKNLHSYGILDTPREKDFDQIVELAAEACNVPTALISFIDRDRQWIKAKVGFKENETDRENSFCQYCIRLGDRIMEVKDTKENLLFMGHPSVNGGPRIRFYAGIPLVSKEGHALGSLCIMDQKPGELGRKEKFILRSLADQVVKDLELRTAFHELQEKHRALNMSMDYARKIQNAIFQPVEDVSDHAPPHFVFLRPMSQVSGDFYWAKEHQGHLYVAAVDCTGHGIPGAFMSILGVSFLNDILNEEEGLLSPGELLDRLRERVVRELKGGHSANGMNDGMDVALVKIPIHYPEPLAPDPKGNSNSVVVEFAGANNPFYVIREGIAEQDAEAFSSVKNRVRPFKGNANGIEIKGDPRPIGHFDRGSEGFTTVSLELRKGDMLYLFSDGFPDQFGGERDKKFRYSAFKALLERIHQKSMKEQKAELKRCLVEWMREGEHKQTDDVLVIGVGL